jgi:Flp pilus assembly protein TadG
VIKDPEAGSAVIEILFVTPVLIVLMLFVVFCGRLQGANQDVRSASGSAARSASLTHDRVRAQRAARTTAERTLAERKISCAVLDVDVGVERSDDRDQGGFGNGDEVTVRVSCLVSLADLSGLGVGGSRTITASATEVVDRYRSTE